MLAGIQHTRADIGNALFKVNANTIGYIGGYYQWPKNWKFKGRIGAQWFEGAQFLSLRSSPLSNRSYGSFDRMDDNDNRLFGVTAEIMWVPKTTYQPTIRTPLYVVRN